MVSLIWRDFFTVLSAKVGIEQSSATANRAPESLNAFIAFIIQLLWCSPASGAQRTLVRGVHKITSIHRTNSRHCLFQGLVEVGNFHFHFHFHFHFPTRFALTESDYPSH